MHENTTHEQHLDDSGGNVTRWLRPVLILSLFGHAHWFFGNLYEAIAVAPNWLDDTRAAIESWRAFSRITNPAYYFVPLFWAATPMSLVALVLARRSPGRRALLSASMCSLAATALTVWVVTQLNWTLFFAEPLPADETLVADLGRQWFWANTVRLALEAAAIAFTWRVLTSLQSVRAARVVDGATAGRPGSG